MWYFCPMGEAFAKSPWVTLFSGTQIAQPLIPEVHTIHTPVGLIFKQELSNILVS